MRTLLLALAVFALTGCTAHPSPDFVAYRESLHSLDQPLYEQHAQLMGEAVSKGIRTTADQTWVQTEIKAAQDAYNASKAADAATTQP